MGGSSFWPICQICIQMNKHNTKYMDLHESHSNRTHIRTFKAHINKNLSEKVHKPIGVKQDMTKLAEGDWMNEELAVRGVFDDDITKCLR